MQLNGLKYFIDLFDIVFYSKIVQGFIYNLVKEIFFGFRCFPLEFIELLKYYLNFSKKNIFFPSFADP